MGARKGRVWLRDTRDAVIDVNHLTGESVEPDLQVIEPSSALIVRQRGEKSQNGDIGQLRAGALLFGQLPQGE